MVKTDWNKFNTPEWYDYYYFADKVGKSFRRSDGSVEYWGFRNPNGAWSGCKPIVEAWKTIFQPKNMLDVGAGRGQFIAVAREVGIDAEGFDFSEFGVNEGRDLQCKQEWLKVHDATQPWFYSDQSFDLLIALDFFEHIYEPNLPFVISEMYRVARKWIFLQIATVDGVKEKGYILKKNAPIPIECEGNAVAGHVTVMPADFWYERFEHEEWMLRRDVVNWFCSLVDKNIIKNWLLNTMIVLERV